MLCVFCLEFTLTSLTSTHSVLLWITPTQHKRYLVCSLLGSLPLPPYGVKPLTFFHNSLSQRLYYIVIVFCFSSLDLNVETLLFISQSTAWPVEAASLLKTQYELNHQKIEKMWNVM